MIRNPGGAAEKTYSVIQDGKVLRLASPGEYVNFRWVRKMTVTSETGYSVPVIEGKTLPQSRVAIDGDNVNYSYYFVMPAEDVTIS